VGVVYSIIVSILFSLYAIPRKWSKQNVVSYMFFLGLTFSAVSIVFFLCVNWTSIGYRENLFSSWQLLSALVGVLWFFGGVFLNKAIDKIGISKSGEWKNLQGPLGSLFMLLFLGEYSSVNIPLTLAGMILIFVSACVLTIERDQMSKKDRAYGITYACLSAVMFAAQTTLTKLLTNKGFIYSKTIYFALFVMITALVVYLIKYQKTEPLSWKNNDNKYPLIAGTIYGFAAIFNVLAYVYLAGSIAFSIISLNSIWTILIGVFYFKEIDYKQNWLKILIGIILAALSIVCLVLAI